MVAVSGYTARDVAKLLELSVDQVRTLARSGLVAGARGPRNEYRFTFQELVLLRVAKDLIGARVPQSRIRRALGQLRDSLPSGRTLSGLQIGAEGENVVVHDGSKRWNPESGQLHFSFDVGDLARRAGPVARRQAREARAGDLTAEEWYDVGCDLEAPAPADARRAYETALDLDPRHAGAHVNLGRLLHEEDDAAAAAEHYAAALEVEPENATAAFNLGVAQEDLGRADDALASYSAALRADPDYADAHYNASELCRAGGRHTEALRHLKRYRELTRP